jgi:hypothetical protein
MQIAHHVEELQRQLLTAAAAGDAQTRECAERLAVTLDAAIRLAILEALSEAAGEITRELAPGSVDVRLRGRDVEFAVTRPVADQAVEGASSAGASGRVADGAASATDGVDDDGSTSRTTLRLPDALKSRAEAAAALAGVSLNTWLVRAVSAALDPRPSGRQPRGSSYEGWVR